jgi:hypothetical protein
MTSTEEALVCWRRGAAWPGVLTASVGGSNVKTAVAQAVARVVEYVGDVVCRLLARLFGGGIQLGQRFLEELGVVASARF